MHVWGLYTCINGNQCIHAVTLMFFLMHVTECSDSQQLLQNQAIVKNTIKAHMLKRIKIPEEPHQLNDILRNIEHRNCFIVSGQGSQRWPSQFLPDERSCPLCSHSLSEPMRVPGSDGKSYLLTKVGLLPVNALIKRCTNRSCTARHSYSKWEEGIYSSISYSDYH